MSKLNRILWTGLVLGIAACGDDVTVVQPPEPTPGIRSVTVAPDGITLAINATAQMTAAVVTDPGATGTPTIAWSTSSATVATVSATGLVTGKAAGSVGITATATLGTSTASGVATVNVTAQTTTPATVSIQSILCANALCGTLGQAANLAATAGAVDVVLNLDRGGEQVTKIQLLVDNVVVSEQAFGASAEASAPELAVEEIRMPWNTAAFNATTGVVSHTNGEHTISAKVITVQNATGSASPSIKLVTANASTFVPVVTITNGSDASDGLGQLWKTGDVEVTLLPVFYIAGTITVNQLVVSGTGFGTGNLPARTLTAAPWKATWLKSDLYNAGSGTKGSGGVEVAGGGVTSGFVLNVASTVNGNSGPGFSGSTGIRLDNLGPAAPIVNENPNGRQAGWINDAVSFTAAATGSSPDRSILTTFADAGVGGTTWRGRAGATLAAAIASSDISNATSLAPTATGTSLCLVLYGIDALGNRSASPSACDAGDADNNTLIGVDRAPPTIDYTLASLSNQARLNGGSIGGEFIVVVADTGAIGNSGVLQPIPVVSNVIRRTAAGTSFNPAPGDCVQGTVTGTSTLVCSMSTSGLAYAAPNVFTAIAGQTTAGYYTHGATAKDGAGNSTPLAAGNVIVYDASPATATNPSVPATITGPFSAAAYLNDNLSIRDYFWTVTYASALITPATINVAAAPTVVDAFNAAVLNNTNYGVNSTVSTFLGLQATDGGNVPQAYAGGDLLSALNLFVRDQAQAAYTGPATSPIAATPGTGIAISAVGPPAWTFTTFVPGTTNATICAGTDPVGNPCGVTPTSTVFSAVANGTTGSFNNPFSRVDFYAANVAGTQLVLIGSVPAASASLVDNGANRAWTYSLSMSGGALYGMLGGVSPNFYGPLNVYAFGVKSTGNVALVSQAVGQSLNP